MIEAMNSLNYQVSNLAERELAGGLSSLKMLRDQSEFPFVSANLVYKETREPFVEPYTFLKKGEKKFLGLFPYGGMDVGIIGVTRPNSAVKLLDDDGREIVAMDPGEALRRYLPEVRRGADLVVLLAFMSRFDLIDLVKDLNGIDIVLAGFGSRFTASPERVEDTWIFYGGDEGKRIIEVRVYEDGSIKDVDYRVHYLDDTYPEDARLLEIQQGAVKKAVERNREKARRRGSTVKR